MTAEEKQKVAEFLDIAGDFLGPGYRTEDKDYKFNDDENVVSVKKAAQAASIEQNNGNSDTLELIAEEIRACRRCRLGDMRTNAAPGEGAERPLVLVIGEGPGAEEDAQGRPFVGRAGQLLDKMLASIDLSRNTNCFIANVVKCRPPGNRAPVSEETSACAGFLRRQIILLRPGIILLAGRVAAQTLLYTNDSIGKLRGKFRDYTVGDLSIPLICTYHPAAILRDESLKRPAWEDLKILKAKINEIYGEN